MLMYAKHVNLLCYVNCAGSSVLCHDSDLDVCAEIDFKANYWQQVERQKTFLNYCAFCEIHHFPVVFLLK